MKSVNITGNIPKLSSNWHVDTLRSFDGTPIRFASYQIKDANPKHVLVFLNGRSEWIEKYSFLPEILQLPDQCGFLTLDHRGQGASGGIRGDIDSFDTYLRDITAVLNQIIPSAPYSILGHSMGGLMSLVGTIKGILVPQKLVISSPLLGFHHPELLKKTLSPLVKIINDSPFATLPSGFQKNHSSPFEENPYTHDAFKYQTIANAPYRVPSPTFRWIWATHKAIQFAHSDKAIAKLSTPTLVLVGSKEVVVDPKAIRSWVHKATNMAKCSVSFRQTPGGKHELLNEIEAYRKTSILSIQFWMNEIWERKAFQN